jgi:hypothetical protein
MKNPFEFGRALNAGELVDRESELSEIVATILDASKLFLIGPRRYGKTSILRAAEKIAIDKGAVVLRYDAEAFATLGQLSAKILADAARQLTPTLEKATHALRDIFGALRPEASVNPQTGAWTVSLYEVQPSAPIPLLVDVLDGVETLAAKARKPVAIILDEFQKVIEEGGPGADSQIRAAVQHHRRVGYVFAGSKTRMLTDMTSDPNRPFYKLGSARFLGAVPRTDFVRFLERHFAAGRIAMQDGAAEAILDASEDVPYNVQLLAHECWDACREPPGKGKKGSEHTTLTVALVREIRDRSALRSDPVYTQLWSALPSTQQRTLLALLRESDEGLNSTAVSRRYDIPTSTLRNSLRLLEVKGILREEQARGTTRLRFEDPLFSAWISLVIPL